MEVDLIPPTKITLVSTSPFKARASGLKYASGRGAPITL
jgi:hypothetical protein